MEAESSRPVLEAVHVDKSYHSARVGRYQVLQDVSLALGKGEFVSLIGPSGGGKTTLLNLLAGLESHDGGSLTVAGAAPGAPPPIAYMQQKDLLLPWRTLWKNVLLGAELRSLGEREQTKTAAAQLLQTFGLARFAGAFPAELSGGMRQRAALARTLLCGREILLLDEPFGALDAITRRHLHGHLLAQWRGLGLTVLLVTHDVEEALALSTRVVLLSGRPGRILDDIPVSVPHGKRAGSPALLRLKNQILTTLDSHVAQETA